jgi:hypothetical protein
VFVPDENARVMLCGVAEPAALVYVAVSQYVVMAEDE